MNPKISYAIGIVLYVLTCTSISAQSLDSILSVDIEDITVRDVRDSLAVAPFTLSRKDFLIQPAAFDDPSRILMHQAGYTPSNDQNNAYQYRGTPSRYNQWSFYGVEIVNPNHLSNAGTVLDIPAATSGGVNMLSGRVLGSTTVYTPFTNTQNYHHGVRLDMSMRRPYRDQITANASLIGLEVGVDEVFGDREHTSLMTNYRYSTVGILSALGADLGDELIDYQDIVASLHHRAGRYSIDATVIYGNSSNLHDPLEDPVEWRDMQNIEYRAEQSIGAISISSDHSKLTLAYSERSDDRSQSYSYQGFHGKQDNQFKNSIWSINLSDQRRWGHKTWTTHLSYVRERFDTNHDGQLYPERYLFIEDSLTVHKYRVGFQLSRTKGNLYYDLSGHIEAQAGDQYATGPVNVAFNPQYLGNLRYRVSPHTYIRVSHSQSTNEPNQYILSANRVENIISPVSILDFSKNWNFELAIDYKSLKISAFVHHFESLLSSNRVSYFHDINELEDLGDGRVSADGRATIKGASAEWSGTMRGYRIHTNLTWLDGRQIVSKDTADIAQAYPIIANLNLHKSYILSPTSVLDVAISQHLRPGGIPRRIDLDASRSAWKTIYYTDDPYPVEDRLALYARTDLRVSYTSSGRWKSVWSLDIQNLLNRQNEAFQVYDPLQDQIVVQNQLGLVPVLSYRVVF